jgi:hypothetical protein
MRRELARALRDLLARYHDPHLQRPTINAQKCHHGTKLWASQNIFAGQTTFDFRPNMAISWSKPYVAPGAGQARQAHESTGLAPRHHVRCP